MSSRLFVFQHSTTLKEIEVIAETELQARTKIEPDQNLDSDDYALIESRTLATESDY